MDMPLDPGFIWPAVVFTFLAVVAAALVLRKTEGPTNSTSAPNIREVSRKQHCPSARSGPLGALSAGSQEQLLCKGTESESAAPTAQDLEEDSFKLQPTNADIKCKTPVAGNEESANAPSVKKVGQEDKPPRYMPGMLRTSQLEKMMSKEELEEERRVQREQLAAIFKLLKENQETFGEVTEKDMEDQLKLYSI